MNHQVTNSYAAQLVAACEERNLFLTAFDIEEYAAHISELSQAFGMNVSVDCVLSQLNEYEDCFDIMVKHFSRRENSRKVFA